ncbi:MAG: SusD/RagB family nutrient-binding outer membrane lipoprotein [Bacteroidales bacterium]
MKTIKYLIIVCLIFTSSVACTSMFNELNQNSLEIPYAPSNSEDSDVSSYLPSLMEKLYATDWLYQKQQNFNSDIYAGYWIQGGAFGRGINVESNYTLVQGWDDNLFNEWANAMTVFRTIERSTKNNPTKINKATYGMALIIKILLSARTADAIGTLPYRAFGTSSTATYDKLSNIYDDFFAELDSALLYLDIKNTNTDGINENEDLFFAGNQAGWVKLANSMRLQLAMRIVKADAEKAQEQAEKAMNSGNLIAEVKDNAAYRHNRIGALTILIYAWNDNTVQSADIVSFILGYNDPRKEIFLTPLDTARLASRITEMGIEYAGSRIGTIGLADAPNRRVFSLPGRGISTVAENKTSREYPESATFFNAAETYFLLAEAALRGWDLGTYTSSAQNLYETGIQKSMNQWKIDMGDYLSSTAKPSGYIDPVNPERDLAPASSISPAWNSSSSNEEHLEQIITQKWLALWPVNSPVAWAEYRRTGYPRLFPAYYSAVSPTITRGGLTVNNARKIKLAFDEYLINPTNTNEARQFLGGDEITTPVWWDVDKPNF